MVKPFASLNPFPERSIVTYEDWRAFVSRPPAVRPEIPTYASYKVMSAQAKKTFNLARTEYHNAFGPIFVPAMEKIHNASLRLATQNLRAQPGARPGIIMDGISTVGKSTIAMQFGRRYERLITNNFQITTTPTGHAFLPVAFVNLPAEMSIRSFNRQLARFYNIPFSKSADSDFLTARILEWAADCATSLFILDDIHFLQIKNRTHQTLNNHFKQLANAVAATFMYAGIDLEGTGLLGEGTSVQKAHMSQTGHRFKKFDLRPFQIENAKSKAEFLSVLTAFERELLLFEQPVNSLAKDLGDYIAARTNGFMGPISTLIREGASIAIRSGAERITTDVLKKIKLDNVSEDQYKARLKQERAAAQRATT